MTTPQASPDMPLAVHADPPAVRLDEHGRFRVGNTRVLLNLVVRAYKNGATAEGIAESYGSLTLADVHGAIAYYLRHKMEVEEYLRRMDVQAGELRSKIERELGSTADLYKRLRERQAAREANR